ncbi:MAG: glycosyltransferase, partial [Acidobacteriota bacterium]
GAQGSGSDGERMLDLARQAGSFAVPLGAVPQQAVALILQCSQLFVLPSLYEGLPLVMLEAAACGCPILVSGLPTIRSWVSRDWLQSGTFDFIPALQTTQADRPVESDVPRFVEALAGFIGKQLKHPVPPAARQSLAKLAADHSWSAVFKRYERAYQEAGEGVQADLDW